MPDAYHHCPMSREESLACVVTWWHEEWRVPALGCGGSDKLQQGVPFTKHPSTSMTLTSQIGHPAKAVPRPLSRF